MERLKGRMSEMKKCTSKVLLYPLCNSIEILQHGGFDEKKSI